jgi:hypothetical protein
VIGSGDCDSEKQLGVYVSDSQMKSFLKTLQGLVK